MLALFVGALQVTGALAAPEAGNAPPLYVHLPGGKFRSVLPPDGKSSLAVIAPYELRALPVTNGEFLRFVETHPQWRRDRVASVFADTALSRAMEFGLATGGRPSDATRDRCQLVCGRGVL